MPIKAFLVWECTERPRMCRRFPETNTKEMSTLLGLLWRRMGTGQKKIFYMKANRKSSQRERRATSSSDEETADDQYLQLLTVESPTTCPHSPGSEDLEINNNNNSNREVTSQPDATGPTPVINRNQADKNTTSESCTTDKSDSQHNTLSHNIDSHDTPDYEISCGTYDETRGLTHRKSSQDSKRSRKEAVNRTQNHDQMYYPTDQLPPFCQHNPMNVLNTDPSSYSPFYSNAAGLFLSSAKPFNNTNCFPNYVPFQSLNTQCYSSGSVPCFIGDQFIPAFQPASSGYHCKNSTATIENYPIPTFQSFENKLPSTNDSRDLRIDNAKYVYGESIRSETNNIYSRGINFSPSSMHLFRSGSSVSSDQFTDNKYISSDVLSAVGYQHATNSHMNNGGVSFQNAYTADITDHHERPFENKTVSEYLPPVSSSDKPINTETSSENDVQTSKQISASSKLPQLEHVDDKNSDDCKISTRMELPSKSAFPSVSTSLYTASMKSLNFLDYYCDEDDDYSGDDEDEFPHLVIDDSFETQPADGVESDSAQSRNEHNRPNTSATDESFPASNPNVPNDPNTSESLIATSLLKQSSVGSQPVQTVTYVYRKNQENVYSTAAIPSINETTRSQLQQLKDFYRESTSSADAKEEEDTETLEESQSTTEVESDFADVSTMCENILKQNCLVEPLGRSPEEKGVQTTTNPEKESQELPVDTNSKQPAQNVTTKHTPLMINKKTYLLPRKKMHPIHTRTSNGTYVRTPVSLINSTVTSDPGVISWDSESPQHKSVSLQHPEQSVFPTSQPAPASTITDQPSPFDTTEPTENKENVKIALLKDLPLIMRHYQQNKLSKPKIIGPLTASAVEGMLSVSLNCDRPIQPDILKYSVPASKFVPGTRDTYRDTGMGNVNKNGNIKRPMNAFMVWARSYRGHLTMLYPNESNKLVSQRLGEIWKKMTMEDKQPYYREADRIKRQHRKDYPDWKYKPNTPKSRTQKIGPHDVLWARFIGASEPTDPQLTSKKLRKIHPPKNPTPPPDARFGKLAIPLFGPPSVQPISLTNVKTTNDQAFKQPIRVEPILKNKPFSGPGRDFCIRRLDVTQPSHLGGANSVISDGNRYLLNVQPSVAGTSLLRPPFIKTLTSASSTIAANQVLTSVPAAVPEMSAVSSENGLGSFHTNTVGWNDISPTSVSQRISFNNTSSITTRHGNNETITTKSNLVNTDGGNPVTFAPLGISLLANSPWNYQIFNQHSSSMAPRMPSGIQSFSQQLASMAQRMPGGVQAYNQHPASMAPQMPSGIQSFSQHLASMAQRIPSGMHAYSEHPAFMAQSMSGGIQSNTAVSGTETKNLTNRFTPEQNRTTEETKQFIKLLPSVTSQMPQDVKNSHPNNADMDKSNKNVHSIASTTSCTSPLRDAHSYVSSVLRSPSAICSPTDGDRAANPGLPQGQPFVQAHSASDKVHLASVPMFTAEAYRKLLEKTNPGGSVQASAVPFFPPQAAWAKPASCTVKIERPAQ